MGERSMNPENEGALGKGRGPVRPRVLWGAGVLASLVVMTTVSMVTVRLATPQIVTFDMKGTMDLFLQQTAQQNLDEVKMKAVVTGFNAAMADSLSAWQSEHHVIILVPPAVVSVQHDITPDIRNDIARRMQAGQPLSLRGAP